MFVLAGYPMYHFFLFLLIFGFSFSFSLDVLPSYSLHMCLDMFLLDVPFVEFNKFLLPIKKKKNKLAFHDFLCDVL